MNVEERVTNVEGDRVTVDKLKADLRVLAADMEQLLKATASQTGQQVARVRAKAEESLKAAQARLTVLQGVALAKTRAAGRATDDYVHANPWQAMAIGAVCGFVLGLLLARGGDSDA
jgi:ElaB/YqjD/DUF883 family membrane-anchored ribosome-binding protein